MIGNTDERSKASVISSREQLQTLSVVYNTEGRMSSEDLNNLNRGSDKVVCNDQSDLDNLYNMIASVGSKGSDRVMSDDKSNLEVSKAMSDDTTVY